MDPLPLSNPIPRRKFIRSATMLSAAAATLSTLGAPFLGGRKQDQTLLSRKIPLGLQLYSLREECKKDLAGILQTVSKIGYKGVEFAGYHGHSAAELRKMLDANGLVACGSHTPYETVLGNELPQTIEFNKTIGNRFLIVPSMTVKSAPEWLERSRLFNDLAEKLKPHGMFIGYHSHAHDFRKYEGKTSWDIFASNTHPEVILQLDTSNCRDGGAEPLEVLKKYPGRTKSIHIKPNGAGGEAVIGEDKIDWPAVFSFCEGPGKTEWYVVEHETSKHPLDAVQRTFSALKKMGKV
jgi:sugar phosphate isomerase/epimerase